MRSDCYCFYFYCWCETQSKGCGTSDPFRVTCPVWGPDCFCRNIILTKYNIFTYALYMRWNIDRLIVFVFIVVVSVKQKLYFFVKKTGSKTTGKSGRVFNQSGHESNYKIKTFWNRSFRFVASTTTTTPTTKTPRFSGCFFSLGRSSPQIVCLPCITCINTWTSNLECMIGTNWNIWKYDCWPAKF